MARGKKKNGGGAQAGAGEFAAFPLLLQTTHMENLLQQITDIGTRLVEARYGAIAVLDEGDDSISRFVISGMDEATRRAIGPPPKGTGVLGLLIREPKTLRIRDLKEFPHSAGFPPHHPEMKSFLGLPLSGREKRYGILYFTEKQGAEEFSVEDERLAGGFAQLAVAAIQSVEAHEQAWRNLEFLKSVVEDSAHSIIITDADRRVILWNPSAESLYGYTQAEVLNRYIAFLIPQEQMEAWEEEQPAILRRLLSGESVRFEAMRQRKDGTQVPVRVTLSPVHDAGQKMIAISSVTEDLTPARRATESLRESERRYREMLENVQLIAVGLDLGGNVTFCNDFLLRLTGWGREEILGRNWFDLFLPADIHEEVKKVHRRTVTSQAVEPHFVNEILTRQGERRLISWSNTVLRDPDKRVMGTMSLGEDITDRRRAEEQLRQSQKLEALGQLASGVAHDFNNALSIISGGVELLGRIVKSETPNPDVIHYLEMIQKSTESASITVKRLQDFARKRSDRPLGWADVNAVVQDVIEITRPRWKNEMEAKGLSVSVHVVSRAGRPYVRGDEAELQELLVNLINNSLDAMPEGGRITVTTENLKGRARVTVADTGTGMTAEVRERAFEPFFTTKGEQGTGLGLSMVFGIVKRYGGSIEIEKSSGAGTTISFTLPLAVEEADPARAESVPEAAPARILIVEDDERLGRIFRTFLEESGHDTDLFQQPELALQALARRSYDLVLTDHGMPGMSGMDLARRIKEASPQTPVLMVTGWEAQIDAEGMAAAGLDRVIGKPVKKSDLQKAVAGVLRGRRSA